MLEVSEMRLELTRANAHYPLKVARLPIPPPGLQKTNPYKDWSEKRDSNPRPRPWQGRALPTELFSHIVKRQPLSDLSTFRAKNGTRTRDPDLGKVVLYQLSYFRISSSGNRYPTYQHFERKTGLEPATPTLARSCSTN